MNYKLAGIISILCAPFLYVNFLTSERNHLTWWTGMYGMIYMIGWICSLIALQRMEILGKSKFAKVAFIIQYVLLAGAQCWNIWVIVGPSYGNVLYNIFDICWPLSNIWMLVIGIATVRAKRLQGWKRFVPLVVGLWFPLMVVPAITIGAMSSIAGPYSAVAFGLLGLVVFQRGEERTEIIDDIVIA
jgi:hypothetical protein